MAIIWFCEPAENELKRGGNMNDSVKVMGLAGSTIICVVALVLGEMNFAYGAASMFGALLGLPPIGRGLQKLFK